MVKSVFPFHLILSAHISKFNIEMGCDNLHFSCHSSCWLNVGAFADLEPAMTSMMMLMMMMLCTISHIPSPNVVLFVILMVAVDWMHFAVTAYDLDMIDVVFGFVACSISSDTNYLHNSMRLASVPYYRWHYCCYYWSNSCMFRLVCAFQVAVYQ